MSQYAKAALCAVSYTGSEKNKKYGIEAVRILLTKPNLADDPDALWEELGRTISDRCKTHNHQTDVVTALWNKSLINREK